MYVPILKWRQGEYLALEQLDDNVKDKVTPLIEIPPIEWDFKSRRLAKTIDEHLNPFARRLHKKWINRKAYLDLNHIDSKTVMTDGTHPLIYIFQGVREKNKNVVPVTGLDRVQTYQDAIKRIIGIDKNGICIRLKIQDIAKFNLEHQLDSALAFFEVHTQDVDIVLDLEAPNYEPLNLFVRVIYSKINKLPLFERCRSFTIASSHFPASMGDLNHGINFVDRLEWKFYLTFCSEIENTRIPKFGDYAVAHPTLLSLDMRVVRPSASLRYTTDNAWYIYKGTNVRVSNGLKQYKNICQELIKSPHFMGAGYSVGDKYIRDCALGTATTGNLTTWRRVGTNHHITKVVNDCANIPEF